MRLNRLATLAPALVVAASLVAAGCGGDGRSSPQATLCSGVPADIGGCDDPPLYRGSTCEELAIEWGREVDSRSRAVIDGPAVVGNEQRSARLHSVLVLATVTLGLRLGEIGLLGQCSAATVLAGAEPSLTDDLRAGIAGALYDGQPEASWEDFTVEASRVLAALDRP